MHFLDQLRLIKKLHTSILRKKTGTASQLAKHLETSRSSLFRYISILTSMGANIQYSYDYNTYFYKENFELNLESLIF
ncbi:HTH domain-containing protein [Lewinella sp. LCG006]|uniref:HTH domain-containing protein n=1 Tax=Lewinella sp. LCG006 TaxID=3231911 RepID=UPI00346026E8